MYKYEPRHDKTNKMRVHPAKTQTCLGIRPVWSVSLCAQWVAKDPSILHADSEASDQTGWMPRLIWVFAGCTLILLVLSCRGSNIAKQDKNRHLSEVGNRSTRSHPLQYHRMDIWIDWNFLSFPGQLQLGMDIQPKLEAVSAETADRFKSKI